VSRRQKEISRVVKSGCILLMEVLKLFLLAGIFGCPTMQKFHEFVVAIASL
jgi:hypothetical protein